VVAKICSEDHELQKLEADFASDVPNNERVVLPNGPGNPQQALWRVHKHIKSLAPESPKKHAKKPEISTPAIIRIKKLVKLFFYIRTYFIY